ncbi:CUB domain-containing protein 1 [Pundamilia nyererei]|uniref:CUB domain-containing protein 1 n=1 Tax=Pundamilia nyererei TaxID=303518 RepID=A0A9Y3VXW5_9CICH|nr:PREDICTED: CUB domain-containing protein 1-like [Pundamilia nyererei]
MRLCRTCALLALLFLAVLDSSESQQEVVRPDKGLNVTVSTEQPKCFVCIISKVNSTQLSRHSSLSLVPEVETTLEFSCPQPVEQSYTVTIAHSIECTENACSPPTLQTQPSILTNFARIFTWNLNAAQDTVVRLSIIEGGLTDTSQPCSDGHQFSVSTSIASSKAETQYCRGGSVNSLYLINPAVVSLQVKPKAQVVSELFQTSVTQLKTEVISVDSSTTMVLSRDPKESVCEVCTAEGPTLTCSTEKTLNNVEKLSVVFSCPKPQDGFNVKIKKTIECTKTSCKPSAAEIVPDQLNAFKRSLTWDISVPESTVITLDFPGGGLKEISAGVTCPDDYQYSVSTIKRSGEIQSNNYCKGGTVSDLNLLGATTVTIEVPKGEKLESAAFNVKATERASRMMSVASEIEKTRIIITKVNQELDCNVCQMAPYKCYPGTLKLFCPCNVSVQFTCPRPQDVFSVEVNRDIDAPFSGDPVQAESSVFPEFNRTFSWDLKTDFTHTFQLDFPEQGLRQISSEETCPDEHKYSFIIYSREQANIGTFCRGGSVTAIQGRYRGRVSLKVPANAKMDPFEFKLSGGPETNMIAIVGVNLPRGVSDTTLVTANFPRDFPDNMQMQWSFTVPGMHNYTVLFDHVTSPECLNNGEVTVEYQAGAKTVTKALKDPQPEHQQGNFNMVLTNCQTNTTLPGLTLNYRVSVVRSGRPVLCTVDLTKDPGVSLQIENLNSDSYCEISINSEVKEKINVTAGSIAKLSFLDCPNEDIRLTAKKVIDCKNTESCPVTTLSVSTMEPCLPMPLNSFTWDLNIPETKTWDLVSPKGSLRQSLPSQECKEPFSLHLAEEEGSNFVGNFCFDGVIQKIQVHANISITAPGQQLSRMTGSFLNISVSEEITETIIYTVSPDTMSPTLLATPNWPQGMKSYRTLSWIVTLPNQYKAQLNFNVTQPQCKEGHTGIDVRTIENRELKLSISENDPSVVEQLVGESFYLNMSNCEPETRQFSALTTINLQRKQNFLPIVLGISGAILFLLLVLAVVCIVTKKKKNQKRNRGSSIYMPKGNIFRPSDMHFTKTRSENESHVYDSIDETMVYGHLLSNSSHGEAFPDQYNGIQTDTYRTFTGPADGALPVIKEPDPQPGDKMFMDPSETFIPSRPRTPINRQDSLGFQDRRMIDNELYTFKTTGDINTIRLSAADMEPIPDDYL